MAHDTAHDMAQGMADDPAHDPAHDPARRRTLVTAGTAAAGLALAGSALPLRAQGERGLKTLRYAFPIAETNFDPAQITDLYSRTVCRSIFDGLLEYTYFSPARLRPNTAAALPEASDDFKTWTVRIRPGIFFADDPAFKGQKRELTAADYAYTLKRHYDPRWKSGNLYLLENVQLLGLSELRKRLMAEKKPFDYDAPVEGLVALDRYTLQFRLGKPDPRFPDNLVDGSFTGAMAREVVEAYGDKIGEHPVGTGPFRLAQWKRSSRIVLERNPSFREVRWDETPPAGDERLARMATEFKGKRLPLVDRVVVSIIEEPQPRWLSFLNEEQDVAEAVPAEFAPVVFPNNRLAPNLAKKGVQMVRYPRADVSMSYFAMEHPVVGGYAPHQVALRRAISLAVDVEREIRIVRRGQAIAAQSVLAPECYGYDPKLKTELSDFNVARAKALLDVHGWVDRNRDGWREQPNGEPLVIEYATQPDQQSRQLTELWKKNMDAIGIRMEFKTAKWPENLKASRAGKLMMWGVGWNAGNPDGQNFLELGYGPNKGQANHARFDLPAFNALYERQAMLPNGPERLKLMQEAARLMVAYMPYKIHVHRIWTDLAQPWVKGFHASHFRNLFWKYVDIDLDELARRGGAAAA
jgi:ABC-type transport system substrate-binding protein